MASHFLAGVFGPAPTFFSACPTRHAAVLKDRTMIKFVALFSFGMTVISALAVVQAAEASKGPLDFAMKSIDGKSVELSSYKGKVVLMVNVASQCGFTKQYSSLEALYKKYQNQGLVILGFPANEFGHQEPGTNEEIAKFCKSKFDVDFPMFAKIVVKGDDISPLYENLTSDKSDPDFAGPVSWNFEKFLIGRDGKVVGRFKSKVEPDSAELTKAVEDQLAKKQ
jgi:glutathione peroxidase